MKSIIKKLGSGIITIMMSFVLFTSQAFAATGVDNGEYTISVQALTATGEISNLADAAITKPVKLNVENDKIYVTVEMKDSMTELTIKNGSNGTEKATVVSQDNNNKKITYKFSVATIDEAAQLEVYVAAMKRNVGFNMNFEKSTLKSIKSQGSEQNTNTNANTNTNTNTNTNKSAGVSNPKTGDSNYSTLPVVVLMASMLSIGVYAKHKAKAINAAK